MDRPSLLLLPPPPRPITRPALNAAYCPPLEAAISALQHDSSGSNGEKLIVAIASSFLQGPSPRHKSLSWPDSQALLAGLYSIVSVICARLTIPTEINAGPGSVDVRVVLVDHDPSSFSQVPSPKAALEPNNTIVVDLPTFAAAYHPWSKIFHVDGEAGNSLLSAYLQLLEGVQVIKQDQIVALKGGLSLTVAPSGEQAVPSQTHPCNVVCLGGTFDHLHPGHKLLLTASVLLLGVPKPEDSSPCRFVIGVTGDELLKRKKYAEFVQSWDTRVANVIDFLSSILKLSKSGWKDNAQPAIVKKDDQVIASFRDGTIEVQCIVLQDVYGPTTAIENMDALVVSGETRSGGEAVNNKRREQGWHPLRVFEADVLDAEERDDTDTTNKTFSTKISSTDIRKQKAESRM